MTKRLASACLFLQLCFSLLGFGQTQFSSADLKGRVTDPSNSVIVGGTVSVRSLSTNASRSAVTNESGEFGIYLLPPGEYEVKVEAPGFESQVRRVTFTVGQIATLNLELRPGAVTIQVDVTDEGLPLLEMGRTHPAATLTQRVIQGLPINGRNFLSFTLLSSGVVEESATVTNSLLPQLPTSRLIFAGQNGRSNSVTIDGVDNNDIAGNGVRPTISQEAVQEFQINHHSYNAELGRSSGGAINIVSKSGTNQLHGNFYDYFRHEKLDARNSFATGLKKPPFKRNQPGFTLGGPVQRDRTFFFAAFEGLVRRESTSTSILSDRSILQPTAGQRDLISALNGSTAADLHLMGQTLETLLTTSENSPFPTGGAPFPMNRTTYKMLSDASGSFPIRQTTSTGSFRADHIATPKDQLLFRYNTTNDSQHGIGVGGLTAPSAGFDIAIRDHAFTFGESHVSSRIVNDFRFQFVREVFNVDTVDPYGPRIAIPGVGNFGRELVDPSDRIQHRYQFLDNFSYTRGKHYFKMGVDFNRYSFDTFSPVFMGGEIDFARLPIPLGGILSPAAATQLVTTLAQPRNVGGLDRPDLIPVITTEPLTILQQVNFGLPVLFNQGFGDPNATLKGKMIGLYWQDSVQVTPSLHLDFGVRYDYEMQPEGVHRDPNNVAPRFGLSYSPSKDGKTVIRAGAGVYFQPLYTATAFSARILGKNQQISNILVSASPDLTPVSPGSNCGLALATAGVPPSFCFFQEIVSRGFLTIPSTRTIPESAYQQLAGLTRQTSTNKLTVRLEDDARDTYSIQSSLGIERQLGRDWNVSATYLFTRALRIIRVRQANALANPAVLDPFGRPTLTLRANPSLLADYVVETAGNSVYHGMTVDLNKRFGRNYQFVGSYTLGKVIDDTIDIQIPQGPQDPTNTRLEKSLSSFDARHRLSLAAIFESPWKSRWLSDFRIAPIVTVRSAFPFNITTGIDINQDNTLNDRPFLVGRNTGRGANYFTTDLRISRRFSIKERASVEFMFDGFNVFNRVNFKEVNGDTGGALRLSDLGITDVRVKASSSIPASRLGGYTAAHDPRIIQAGVKVNF